MGLEKCFSKIWHPRLELNSNLNIKDIFFMIDLDGTLLDTDYLHYEGYYNSLKNYNIDIKYNDYLDILNNKGIDFFLDNNYPDHKIEIKLNKNKYIRNIEKLNFMQNADIFINYIDTYKINHVVVTNTSNENVSFFKKKLPLLNKLKNWIVREDYINPKPDSECYIIGKKNFYKNEKYIIGIENSIAGYKALKNITDCIYILTNKNDIQYNYFKKNDIYLINDYISIFV